jgi:hypothetical protein
MQQLLASVRTDLDSFSDVEAYALMTSAYRMTEQAFAEGRCVEGFGAPVAPVDWDFLAVEAGMKGVGPQYKYVSRLLGVSGSLAFKIWKLKKWLQHLAILLAVAALALGGLAVVTYWDSVLLKAVTVGALVMILVSVGLTALGTALVGKKVMRVARLRETLARATFGFVVGIVGWIAARLHLLVFDPMFLREGNMKNYLRHFPSAERRGKDDASQGGGRQETYAREEAPSPEAAPSPVIPVAAPMPSGGSNAERVPEPTAAAAGYVTEQVDIRDEDLRA